MPIEPDFPGVIANLQEQINALKRRALPTAGSTTLQKTVDDLTLAQADLAATQDAMPVIMADYAKTENFAVTDTSAYTTGPVISFTVPDGKTRVVVIAVSSLSLVPVGDPATRYVGLQLSFGDSMAEYLRQRVPTRPLPGVGQTAVAKTADSWTLSELVPGNTMRVKALMLPSDATSFPADPLNTCDLAISLTFVN